MPQLNVLEPSARGRRLPSILLVLVAAAIVAALRPRWLSLPLQAACVSEGISPQRVSRLKARLLEPFEKLLAKATRRGRPPGSPAGPPADRAAILEALLQVAAAVVQALGVRSRDLQDQLVTAFNQLRTEHGVTQKAFCSALGLSGRTFRSWAARAPARGSSPSLVTSAPAQARKRSPRRQDLNFDLATTLPGIQAMADTSHWTVLGTKLYLISLQDPGLRRQRLSEGFALEAREDAKAIMAIVGRVLSERPGDFVSLRWGDSPPIPPQPDAQK